MAKHNATVAVFPGSFDPVTNGHLDVIRRGAGLFDELVVAVGENPDKSVLLDRQQRVQIIREAVAELPNVRVEAFSGLTAEYARRQGAAAILRGIRGSTDLRRELQMALTNRVVAGVETIFIMTGPEYAYASSSLIKQIAQMGGDVSAFVPPQVVAAIGAHLDRQAGEDAHKPLA